MNADWQEEVIERLTRIETMAAYAHTKAKDHEERIRRVETRQWLFAGAAAAVWPLLERVLHILPIKVTP